MIKALYADMGLTQAAINSRISQGAMLSNMNPAYSLTGKGGGVSMAYDAQSGLASRPIVVHDLAEASALRQAVENRMPRAMDDDTYAFNIPSNGVPLPLLTIWTTRSIEQIYKKTTLSRLTGSWQQGAPGVMEIKIPTIGLDGRVDIYDDYSMNGATSLNTNWITRNIGYFEETMGWGTMQAAQYGLAKIDYTNRLRETMAITIAQFQNDLGFQGYLGIPSTNAPMLWGILNEPNLNAAISLPADGQTPGTLTPTTAWQGKSYSQILRDVQLLVAQVMLQALGHINIDSPFIMALPPSAAAYLTTSTVYGVTVAEQLKKMFSGIEIVSTPNFEASLVLSGAETNQTVIMLLFKNDENGEMPYDELFVTKWQGHRPVPMSSSVSEKISMGLGGVFLKYPLYVSYAYGV